MCSTHGVPAVTELSPSELVLGLPRREEDMTNRTYPQGVPCWIDTQQPDVEAAASFYGSLFGWTL